MCNSEKVGALSSQTGQDPVVFVYDNGRCWEKWGEMSILMPGGVTHPEEHRICILITFAVLCDSG